MYSVTDSWQNIIPICGNHKGERIEMTVNSGPHSMFYSCPKYYPQNRTKDERACSNRINLIEYEAMVDHIHGLIAEADVSGGNIDLTNHSWSRKGIDYRVLEHKGDKVYVEILNRKALR